MMGLEVAVGDQRSPSQWWLWVHVVLCVCRCGKNVKESLSAKRLDFVCLLYAIQWGDWVAGTASGHTRNLSLAAGGIYAVHINKHAQTYIWTVLSYIYTYIYPSEQGAGALWHSVLALPPAQPEGLVLPVLMSALWVHLCSLCGQLCIYVYILHTQLPVDY